MSEIDKNIKQLLTELPPILQQDQGHFKSQGPGSTARRMPHLWKPEKPKKVESIS